MFKLALVAGHYLGTPGKRCLKSIDPKETREWWLNNRICDKIETLLADYEGIRVIRIDDTTGKNEITLAKRVAKANEWCADFYLSVHHNAGINGGKGGGIMAFVYNNASQKSIEWQKALYDELIKETALKGNRADPLSKSNLYEVKVTKMPAVLLELGFMDSTTDTPIILTDDFANKCAKACVNVIVSTAKLSKKKAEVKVEPKLSKPTKPKKTIEEIAKEVIANKWGVGEERKKKLTAEGYNYTEVQKKVNELLAKESNSKYFPKYTGKSGSIIDALKSLKIDSSRAYRTKIAKKNGILFYAGWASQNIKLLNLLKKGKLLKP